MRPRIEHPAARLTILWAALAGLRWIAALPIVEPRIFRDELLHWQLAKAIAAHQPFTFFGQPLDYPAVLYPAAISVVFHAVDGRAAFDLVRGLNAAFVSAVVFPAYLLARELTDVRTALLAACLAGLAPGGVYSALIMQESLYYPLFVLSCWLCLRVLAHGKPRDALACALALSVTYLTKPLALMLVAAYGVTAAWWLARHRQGATLPALAIRLAPIAALGATLAVRHFLAPGGGDADSASDFLLSRFYAQELGGPVLPPIVPLAAVVVGLVAALALGTGVAPLAGMVRRGGAKPGDGLGAGLRVFALVVTAAYVVAAARHTLLLNDAPKMHERYLFAMGPLLFTLLLGRRAAPVSRWAVGAVCLLVVLAVAPLGRTVLTDRTWVDAPSLTLPWFLRRTWHSGGLAALAVGSLAGAVGLAARRAGDTPTVAAAWMAGWLVLLNGGWYLALYRQNYLDATSALVQVFEHRLEPADRVTIVQDGGEIPQRLTQHFKFWLGERVTGYWAAGGDASGYSDRSGPLAEAVRRTDAAYVIARPGFDAVCPGARAAAEFAPAPALGVVVFAIPHGTCGRG